MTCKYGLKEHNKPKLNLTVWKDRLNKAQHSINEVVLDFIIALLLMFDYCFQCSKNKMWKDLLPECFSIYEFSIWDTTLYIAASTKHFLTLFLLWIIDLLYKASFMSREVGVSWIYPSSINWLIHFWATGKLLGAFFDWLLTEGLS